MESRLLRAVIRRQRSSGRPLAEPSLNVTRRAYPMHQREAMVKEPERRALREV